MASRVLPGWPDLKLMGVFLLGMLSLISAPVVTATTDPILHWSFDNATATDASPNANSGSLIGFPASVPGQVNLALNFNGENDGVNLSIVNALPSGNTPHTIAAWIKINSLPANRAWLLLLGQEGGGAHHWLINNNGLTQLGVWEGNQLQPTLTAGIWQHLAMTFDGTNLTGYINGTTIGTTPASFNLQGLPLTLATSHIGENYFNGTIDELKIYDRALSATEVSALASTAPPPANTPPTVNLTAPANNASFTAPATISLTATASDTDGTITQVEFFHGTTLLSTDTTGADGYSYTWTNVPQGSYTLTAKATDNSSAITTSAPINVTVNPTPAPVAQLYYVYPDHLGTPRVITDTTNQPRWRWDNTDPFGANLPNDDPDQDGVKFVYNLRFPGQYYDQETGLHYNYHRTYDPGIGRYTQFDPIGLAGGINGYGYSDHNPLSNIDPYGLQAIPWPIGPPGWVPTPGVPEKPKPNPGYPFFPAPSEPGWSWPSIPGWLNPFKSEQQRCEEECDKDYDFERKQCEAWWMTTGRNAGAYRKCMDRVRENYIKCFQNCPKGCDMRNRNGS